MRPKSPHCVHCGMTLLSIQGIWYALRYAGGDFSYTAACDVGGALHEPQAAREWAE
jgi:hypothetical protein